MHYKSDIAMYIRKKKEHGSEHTDAIAFILLSLPLHRLFDDCLPGTVPPSLPVFDAVM